LKFLYPFRRQFLEYPISIFAQNHIFYVVAMMLIPNIYSLHQILLYCC